MSTISHAGKVLLHILNKHLKYYISRKITIEQAGFVKGSGTIEQILNIRQLIQKSREFNIPIALCFIDNAKAFDLDWRKMSEVLGKMGILEHLSFLVQNPAGRQISWP